MNFFRSKSKSPSRSSKDGSFLKRSLSSRSQNNREQPQYHNSSGLYPSPIQPPAAKSSMDQPPAYTPSPVSPTSPVAPGPMSSTSDSAYSFLTQFDTIFLIDDSGSMAGRSWKETAAALAAITPICTTYDADGIDIYFLNHRNAFGAETGGAYTKVTTEGLVHEIFTNVSPRGGTPTGTRLNHILKPYIERVEAMSQVNNSGNPDLNVRPLNIIVITDGVPSDDVESVIVNAARKLDALSAPPWQVGIQFFQVGNEPEAAEDLQELDDNLSEQKGVRDMVDTVPWNAGGRGGLTADGILKVVLGAVHKKYDRRNASGRRQRC